jgi:hypothetical protein
MLRPGAASIADKRRGSRCGRGVFPWPSRLEAEAHEEGPSVLMLKARLHPLAKGRYSVLFNGRLLVEGSRDPECDAARALVAQGITGKLTLCDGKTGTPRTIIDIERAARLTVEEGPNGPRFRRFRAWRTRLQTRKASSRCLTAWRQLKPSVTFPLASRPGGFPEKEGSKTGNIRGRRRLRKRQRVSLNLKCRLCAMTLNRWFGLT